MCNLSEQCSLHFILQADSSCQLSATAGGTTAVGASSDAVVESGTDSIDNIEWLKWTGAAALFVEGLIVSSNLFSHSILGVAGSIMFAVVSIEHMQAWKPSGRLTCPMTCLN